MLFQRYIPDKMHYDAKLRSLRAGEAELAHQRQTGVPDGPHFSLVLFFRTADAEHLLATLRSLEVQTYQNYSVCISAPRDGLVRHSYGKKLAVGSFLKAHSDTDRVHYFPVRPGTMRPAGINIAVRHAEGDYLAFLESGDTLEADALFQAALLIRTKKADLLYTDEDSMRDGRYFDPLLKPDFNLDLLRSENYIGHLLIIRRALAAAAGGYRTAAGAGADYDFVLRCAERARRPEHLAKPLYHACEGSRAFGRGRIAGTHTEDELRVLSEHLERCRLTGKPEAMKTEGCYHISYSTGKLPRISVIVMNSDDTATLKSCMESLEDAGYDNLEVVIAEIGSRERETFEYYETLSGKSNIRLVRWKRPWNAFKIRNYAAGFASGDFLLFLNPRLRGELSDNWLHEMVGVCARPGTGIVGGKIYYSDNRVRHAGYIIGKGEAAGTQFEGLSRGRNGYMNRAALLQEISAVSEDCMMVRKSVFDDLSGFSGIYQDRYGDVDLCLRAAQKGWKVVFDPFAELFYEGDDTDPVFGASRADAERFRADWGGLLENGDPFYNKNFSIKKDYQL